MKRFFVIFLLLVPWLWAADRNVIDSSDIDFQESGADLIAIIIDDSHAHVIANVDSMTSAALAGQVSDETGTTLLVYNTSPTLVTPVLGTITSGVGTALTALNGENIQDDTIDDDSIDFADVTLLDFGLAATHDTSTELDALYEAELTNSAGLLAALSDETGTGVAVFGTAPTFTTSITMGAAGLSEAELEILDGATITTAETDTLSDGSNADSLHVHASAGLSGIVNADLSGTAGISDANVDNDLTIDLATLATTLTITDNEETAETNAVLFTAGAALTGGNLGIESDGDFTYTPNTGTVGATEFVGGGVGLTGIEGTQILSTGEGGATKFLREDGDGTSSWQAATASHAGTITWSGTSILETGAAFQFGDATDATLTHTYGNTGTNVSIAYSTAAMAVTGALTATNLSNTNTGDNTVATTGDAAVDFFGAGVDAVTDGTECTDIEGTNLSITAGTLNVGDAFVINSGNDSMAGTLTADGLTLGANENITLGGQTLDHDGTDFVLNDSLNLGANALKSTVNQPGVPHMWSFTVPDPNTFYDTAQEVCIIPKTTAALKVTAIEVTSDINPDTETTLTLKYADAFIGLASAATVATITTAVGVYSSSGDADAIPANKCAYVVFGSDPDVALEQISFQFVWDYD